MKNHSFRDLCGLVAKTYRRKHCRTCDGREYTTMPIDGSGRVMMLEDSGVVRSHDNFPCPTCHPEQWRPDVVSPHGRDSVPSDT